VHALYSTDGVVDPTNGFKTEPRGKPKNSTVLPTQSVPVSGNQSHPADGQHSELGNETTDGKRFVTDLDQKNTVDRAVTGPNRGVTEHKKVVTELNEIVTDPKKVVTEPNKVVTDPKKFVSELNGTATKQEGVVTNSRKLPTSPVDGSNRTEEAWHILPLTGAPNSYIVNCK
jgi:hypothetical protein